MNCEENDPNFSIIELNDISRSYGYGDAKSFALKNFSLSVKRGEFIMVMGPSGCGKTTLLNIIGLLDRPTSGNYFLSGKRTQRLSNAKKAHLRARKIGFIFQNFNLIPTLPVIENVALPLIYGGYSKTGRLIAASDILSRFHLQEREYYMPYQLSGGQQQRVAIARSLVGKPEIILADEPTGNLDSRSSHNVMEELRAIHEEGNTIIMVTHNPALTTYATRVIHMLDGQIDTDIKTVDDRNLPQSVHVSFARRQAAEASHSSQPTSATNELPPLQRPGEKKPDFKIPAPNEPKTLDDLYEENSLNDEATFNDFTVPKKSPTPPVSVPKKSSTPAAPSTPTRSFPTVGSAISDKSVHHKKSRHDFIKDKAKLELKMRMTEKKRIAEESRPPVTVEIPTDSTKNKKGRI